MNPRRDFLLGMLAGTAFGLAAAMIFVDPGLITPDNIRARGAVAVCGLAVAMIVQTVFERMKRKRDCDGQTGP